MLSPTPKDVFLGTEVLEDVQSHQKRRHHVVMRCQKRDLMTLLGKVVHDLLAADKKSIIFGEAPPQKKRQPVCSIRKKQENM